MTSDEFDSQVNAERMAGALIMRAGEYEYYVVGYKSPDDKHCCFVRQPCKTSADLDRIARDLPGYWEVMYRRQIDFWLDQLKK